MGPLRWATWPIACLAPAVLRTASAVQCAGTVQVKGENPVAIVNAKWNQPGDPVGQVEVKDGQVVPYMSGRAYFADSCDEGSYDHGVYSAWALLGKTLRYTTHLAAASCGCNAALYLVSMRQNPEVSDCEDFYCDANSVCGVRCAEIDIQEGNVRAWHSTLHVPDDGGGVGQGLGGGAAGFTEEEYGPGARCVDTLLPFQVSASFPVNDEGTLEAMEVTLSQENHDCPLTLRVDEYAFAGRDGLEELSAALADGMAPVISYWKSEDMGWMDGGPCESDDTSGCGDSVRFYDFSIADLAVSPAEAFDPAPIDDDASAILDVLSPTGGDEGVVEPVTNGASPVAPAPAPDAPVATSEAAEVLRAADDESRPGDQGDAAGEDSTSPGVFNCQDGLDNWQWEWSPKKMEWCCKWQNEGCSPSDAVAHSESATDAPADASAGTSDDSSPTPAPEASTTAAVAAAAPELTGAAAEDRPAFDCEGGASVQDWLWSPEHRSFCCAEQGRGCTTTARPGGGASQAGRVGRPFGSSQTGLAERKVAVGEVERPFSLYVPAPCGSGGGDSMPLWILAPGSDTDPESQLSMSGLTSLADRHSFMVAALQGEGDNLNVQAKARASETRPDDVAYVRAVVNDVRKAFCVDARRIFCTGFSRGARFCSRLASQLSDVVAAVAAVGGVRYPEPNNASRPVPMLAFHGTSDPVNPYAGSDKEDGYWHAPVASVIAKWADFNGCSLKNSTRPSPGVTVELRSSCKEGADVLLFTVEDGGHTWPGSDYGFKPDQGLVSKEISASDAMVKFFAAHALELADGWQPVEKAPLREASVESPEDSEGSVDSAPAAAEGAPASGARDQHTRAGHSLALGMDGAFHSQWSLLVGVGILVMLATLTLSARCWTQSFCGVDSEHRDSHRLVSMHDNGEIRIKVVDIAGRRTLHVLAASWASVETLKEQIAAENRVPVEEQSLFFGGRTLEAREQLGTLGVHDTSTVYLARHLKMKPRGGWLS